MAYIPAPIEEAPRVTLTDRPFLAFCNFAFDPDRAWRTCCYVLPIGVVFGCWMGELLS